MSNLYCWVSFFPRLLPKIIFLGLAGSVIIYRRSMTNACNYVAGITTEVLEIFSKIQVK